MSMQIKKQKGQGMAEYIIIVALIGLAAIGAFSYFGDAVRNQGTQMTNEIAGSDTYTAGNTNATTAATNAGAASVTAHANLANYNARDGK